MTPHSRPLGERDLYRVNRLGKEVVIVRTNKREADA